MPIPRSVARFNRHVTNPLQRHWADRLPGFGLLEHAGRAPDGAIPHRSTWSALQRVRDRRGVRGAQLRLRNVLAADGAILTYRRQALRPHRPQLVRGDAAAAVLPRFARAYSRAVGTESVLTVAATAA